MTQLERTRASVVMNINESHYSAIPWDKEGERSRGVSGCQAQGGDVGTTMETQCPVEDPHAARRVVPSSDSPHERCVSGDIRAMRSPRDTDHRGRKQSVVKQLLGDDFETQ